MLNSTVLRVLSVEELTECDVARGWCLVVWDVSARGLIVLGKAERKTLDQEWRTLMRAHVHGHSEDRNKVL